MVEGKRTLDAFHATNIDFLFRVNCIKNVAFCGFLTNVFVERTVSSAYDNDKGFTVFILKDCCADMSGELQKYVGEKFFAYVGEALTHDDFLERLE